MQSKRVKRLLELKRKMEDLAKVEFGQVQGQLNSAVTAFEDLQSAPADAVSKGTLDRTFIHLAQRAALSTAFAIEEFREERDKKKATFMARRQETRQMDTLYGKITKRERAEAEKREQKALDDWATTVWGRRK
ncbi:MAG: flagellar FliJ family protein [Myxococcota bacterium]|nr:flagellar FliJ family protein [Myxococcota bacterium]